MYRVRTDSHFHLPILGASLPVSRTELDVESPTKIWVKFCSAVFSDNTACKRKTDE